jgi:uncharacterized UPF0160 family protein
LQRCNYKAFHHLKSAVRAPLLQLMLRFCRRRPQVYQNFIEEVDGNDNGVNPFDGAPRYCVSTALASRVGRLNPLWNEDASPAAANAQFRRAAALTLSELTAYVRGLAASWWPARAIVAASLAAATGAEGSGDSAGGAILTLRGYCPWKDLEREGGFFGRTKFVLYSEGTGGGGWRVQAVPLADAGFENRAPLLRAWWGVRDAELSTLSGIDGCVFVHANGFIGGNKTYEGALAMAKASLEAMEAEGGAK